MEHDGPPIDASNGYEQYATAYIVRRSPAIGVPEVRRWAASLPPGATVLDLGCGYGVPISKALIDAGLSVYGIDASPTLVAAFHERFPGVPVRCEPVETSDFFGRKFDGVNAWGVLFLLSEDAQRALIRRVATVLDPNGRFLFTAPFSKWAWDDAMTQQRSVSLGGDAYRRLLEESGLRVVAEFDDEGDNHYYDAVNRGDAA